MNTIKAIETNISRVLETNQGIISRAFTLTGSVYKDNRNKKIAAIAIFDIITELRAYTCLCFSLAFSTNNESEKNKWLKFNLEIFYILNSIFNLISELLFEGGKTIDKNNGWKKTVLADSQLYCLVCTEYGYLTDQFKLLNNFD